MLVTPITIRFRPTWCKESLSFQGRTTAHKVNIGNPSARPADKDMNQLSKIVVGAVIVWIGVYLVVYLVFVLSGDTSLAEEEAW